MPIYYVLDPSQSNDDRQRTVRAFTQRAEQRGRERRTVLEAKDETRGVAQNAYYWSAVIGTITEHMREHYAMDHAPEVWHEYLKALYSDPVVTEIDGQAVRVYRSTTRMGKGEFSVYVDRVIDHAAREWSCAIPPPREIGL